MRQIAVLLACLVAWAANDALAQAATPAEGGPKGTMNAVAFSPMPSNTPIAVRPLDDSDVNVRLKKMLEATLRSKGFNVDDKATLVMTVETRDEVGSWTDQGRRSLIELQAKGGRDGGEDAQAMLNIYNSTRGGLLNEGRGGTSIATPSTYRINVTVDDRNNGKRIWQGWTVADLGHGDRETLSKAMVPALMGHLGLTVSLQPFDIK